MFDALGADTYVINAQPNGTNINNNAGSTHIEGLQKFVVEKGLDVGFAYDGDADRCLCVDEKGNVITGDHILYIYGCYMKERGKLLTNTVVTTVMSNFGLYKAFDEQGIGYAKTAVGDKYVYEYMAKNGCRIGGEQSGHIIFSKYASTGDGILTSLKMMEVMLAKKLPMSKLAEPLKIYPQVLENVRVTDKKAAQNDPAVQEAVKAVAEALGDTGRILVRESGTEPVVRVMVEAPDHDTCQKYVSQVVEVIKNKGYAVTAGYFNINLLKGAAAVLRYIIVEVLLRILWGLTFDNFIVALVYYVTLFVLSALILVNWLIMWKNLPEYYKNSFIAIYEEKLQINLKDEYDISNTQESAGLE